MPMSRGLQSLIALVLFLGTGFVSRYCFREWMDSLIKDSGAATKNETADWKGVSADFSGIKVDQPGKSMPKFNPPIIVTPRFNPPIIVTPRPDFSRPPAIPGRR
jgi:hypothetical protein